MRLGVAGGNGIGRFKGFTVVTNCAAPMSLAISNAARANRSAVKRAYGLPHVLQRCSFQRPYKSVNAFFNLVPFSVHPLRSPPSTRFFSMVMLLNPFIWAKIPELNPPGAHVQRQGSLFREAVISSSPRAASRTWTSACSCGLSRREQLARSRRPLAGACRAAVSIAKLLPRSLAHALQLPVVCLKVTR